MQYFNWKNLVSIQDDFSVSVASAKMIDCNGFLQIKKTGYAPKCFVPGKYLSIYDVQENNRFVLYKEGLKLLNEKYDCSYYIAGRLEGSYIGSTTFLNGTTFEISLLLVLYDKQGHKVWSEPFKRKYESIDNTKTVSETYYIYYTKLLKDCKNEINNRLAQK
jgi:hypothetical protein